MLIVATQKNTRQAPRKVRLVANSVKKLPLEQAIKQLALVERKSTVVLLKVMRQALANAWHNHNLKLEDLKLNNILIETGPVYKRYRSVSRGRAHSIFKRTCHVRVILEAKQDQVVAPKVTEPAEKATVKVAEKTETKKVKAINKQPELVKSDKKIAATKAVKQQATKKIRTKSFGGRK